MIALVDVGGTKLAAAAGGDGVLEEAVRVPTREDDPEAQLVRLLESVTHGRPVAAVGMSVPGPFDRAQGRLEEPPGMPRTWFGLDCAGLLGRHFGCPVLLENDANCAALAEARHGAGRDCRTVVYFTVSTGIGTGIVIDGRLHTGHRDTEGGHQVLWPEWTGGIACHCGGHGCLEALASGRAIERRFGRRAEALDDPVAWEDVGRWLGLGVVNATALLDPEIVIFGGGVTRSWPRFEPSLRRTVAEHLRLQATPRIELGSIGETRNLLGALEMVSGAS